MSEFFLSGRIHNRNCGGPGSLDLMASNILSTLTGADSRLNWGLSSNTSNGLLMLCKNRKVNVDQFAMMKSISYY
jgi:hypothetical protein